MRIIVRGTGKAIQLGERMRDLPERMSARVAPVLFENVQNSIRQRAYRTGALMASAQAAANRNQARAFTFLDYGKYIEYGTHRMSERKPFRIARDETLKEARNILKELVKE